MKASILAIGDEIVGGRTPDTNSGWLGQLLHSAGLDVAGFLTVPDEPDAIVRALARAFEDAEICITTGGLGPTVDDLTSAAIARFVGTDLVLDQPSLERIEQRFRDRDLEMPANNRKQALIPGGATVIPNPRGTAPGFLCPLPGQADRWIATLPGVPREMMTMAEETLLPWLASLGSGRTLRARTYSTFGLTESQLDEMLVGVVAEDEARLAFRASFPRLQARVSVEASSAAAAEAKLDGIEERVRERLGESLYAVGDAGLETALGHLLRDRSLTLTVAESCTGGLIGHRVTDVPGSSAYFLGGVVAYSNEAKQALLGVRGETLARHGAVSGQTVREMADGARRVTGADLAIATSGVAGPGGGTVDKPVGTVWIAVTGRDTDWQRRYDLGARPREWIKEMTAQLAMYSARRILLEITEATDR